MIKTLLLTFPAMLFFAGCAIQEPEPSRELIYDEVAQSTFISKYLKNKKSDVEKVAIDKAVLNVIKIDNKATIVKSKPSILRKVKNKDIRTYRDLLDIMTSHYSLYGYRIHLGMVQKLEAFNFSINNKKVSNQISSDLKKAFLKDVKDNPLLDYKEIKKALENPTEKEIKIIEREIQWN